MNGSQMPKLIRAVLIALLATFFVDIFVGCGNPGNSTPAAAPSGPGSSGTSTVTAHGTSDSGGCNGIEGRCYDSYIVDPTQLPAYTQYLAKIFANVKEDVSAGSDAIKYDFFLKTKTWYILPSQLEPIDKFVLGATVLTSNTDQIARQTMREIWIDRDIYNKMLVKDQGVVLLHEFVMSLYFFKFMSYSEICQRSVGIDPVHSKGCEQNEIALVEKLMPAEKQTPLSAKDYENIRYVTGWLEAALTKPVTKDEFFKVLVANGFDKRFFRSDDWQKNPPKDIMMTHQQFLDAIVGTDRSGHMPSLCTKFSGGNPQKCDVQLADQFATIGKASVSGFELQVSSGANSVSLLNMTGDEINLFPEPDVNGHLIYSLAIGDWHMQKYKIGDRVYSGFLIFSKESEAEQSGFTLQSIVIRPGIIVSIDKTRSVVCQLETPKIKTFFDDGVVITRDDASPGPIEKMFSLTPPMAACSPDSVSE
jgi:hypothetical protein